MNWNVNWWHLERFEAAVDVERRVITLSVAAVQRTGLIVVDYIVTGRRQRPLVRLWRRRSWRHQQRSWRHRVPAVRQRRVAIQRTVRTAVNIFFCLFVKWNVKSIDRWLRSINIWTCCAPFTGEVPIRARLGCWKRRSSYQMKNDRLRAAAAVAAAVPPPLQLLCHRLVSPVSHQNSKLLVNWTRTRSAVH